MPVILTHELHPGAHHPEQDQIYNGLDCALTIEIFEEITRQHNEAQGPIYQFEKALQAPILEMMLRGFKIDEFERQRAIAQLREKMSDVYGLLQQFAQAVWGRELNPRSSDQLKAFFYGAMKLPEEWQSKKGIRKLSMDREALEKLEDKYFYSRPIIAAILSYRDLAKLCETIETQLDRDGRWRSSYNIGGTECVAGETLIWTKSGLRTAEEIYKSPYRCAIWNGSEFVDPARKVKYDNRAGVHLMLENGYQLKCTLNHPVMTPTGWKAAGNLCIGDKLELNVGLSTLFGQHVTPANAPFTLLSEDFCEFVGMWLADGSLNVNEEHNRCRLSNSDESVLRRFAYLAESLFSVNVGMSGPEAYFSSKIYCKWFKSIGLHADCGLGTATIKTIPGFLLRGKPNLIRALLRGLTLDTHITEKGLMFGTQSLVMREQVQQALLILGIRSVKLQTGNSIKLNVPRSFCGRFLSLVGFVQETKAWELTRLLNSRCQWHEPECFGSKLFVEVVAFTNWQGDVFDFTMPETSPPQYVANGLTVHNTGRLSSSKSAFGTGSNAQNLKRDDDIAEGMPSIRRMFIADDGMKLCNIDLEQTESFDVGFLQGSILGDWKYLDACERGDLHTQVARMVWPELPWTGDLKADRKIAERPFYRHFTYRDMAKRGGHLTNYMGTAWTMAKSLKIPQKLAETFQESYAVGQEAAFPAFPKWWQHVAQELQTSQQLTTPYGRTRHFFGRPRDDTTLREAIAFVPQSSTADRMNLGLWRIWKFLGHRVQLLGQVHDSVCFQYPEGENEVELIGAALKLTRVPLTAANGRQMTVGAEAKVGWNWGSWDAKVNPNGLKKWSPAQPDIRQRNLVRIL